MPTKEHPMGEPDLEATIQIYLLGEIYPSVFQMNAAMHNSSKP